MLNLFRQMRAAIAVVSAAGSMLGCLGIHDLTPPSTDASTPDGSAASDDATVPNDSATNDAGTSSDASGGQACVSVALCTPAECQTGTFACTSAGGTCMK